ncbi:MAG TPA: chromosomal replication initiator protein DnaA [Dehalococcoidia bacterium]|nr:chromosomal replication initiator protein DnaA [Dehalococcoidia bacterium]
MVTEAQRLWNAALGQLEMQVTRANFETWLRSTEGTAYDGSLLQVSVPTEFTRQWLTSQLTPLIRKTLSSIEGRPLDVAFHVRTNGSREDLRLATDEPRPAPTSASSRPRGTGLLGRYTFDTFVAGASNLLAYSAAQSVCSSPTAIYNPLYIYGGAGLGKTHLLHAIGNELAGQGRAVLYVSAERFTNDYIRAILDRAFEDFRARYRTPEVLLVDDVHFLAGKDQMQEEFFHTFNEVYGQGHQIVLTSDLPPASISLFEDRLRSRFEWGLIVDIQPPDKEMRIAILQAKAQLQGFDLSPEVAEIVASRRQRNIRELEGVLNRLTALARLRGGTITPAMAEEVLAAIGPDATETDRISPDEFIDAVALYYRVSSDDLRGQGRQKHLALARHVAMYLMREYGKLPLSEIGRHLGKRDHTTVLHGVSKVSASVVRDASLRRDILAIRESLSRRNPPSWKNRA